MPKPLVRLGCILEGSGEQEIGLLETTTQASCLAMTLVKTTYRKRA